MMGSFAPAATKSSGAKIRRPLPETARPLMRETCRSSKSTWLLKRVLSVSITRPLRIGSARLSMISPTTSSTASAASAIQPANRHPLCFADLRFLIVQPVIFDGTQNEPSYNDAVSSVFSFRAEA